MISRLLIPTLLALPLCAQAPAPSSAPAVHIILQADPPPEGTPALDTAPVVKALDAFTHEHGLVKAPSGGDEWVLGIRVSVHKGLNGYQVADGILRLSRFEGGKILPGSVKDALAVACSKDVANLADEFGKSAVKSGSALLSKAKILAGDPDGSGIPADPTSPIRGEKEASILFQPIQDPYPPEAIMQRVQGRALLDVWVGADGIPKSVTVVEGPKLLTSYTSNWALKWRFHPAEHDGKPIDSHYTLSAYFKVR